VISSEDIVWVGDPEACWGLIRVQQTPRFLGQDGKIVLKVILGLSGIFNEESMALNVERNVLSYSEIVDTVNGAGSVERLLNSVTLNVRIVNDSNQMEVNRIPTKLEGLPYIEELNVLDPGYQVLHAIRMHHDLGTVFILG